MGTSSAARIARIRAAMTQWPTLVVKAMRTRQTASTINATRPVDAYRTTNSVTSSNNAIKNPATFTTESERVTIAPASSLAFGNPCARKTPNAAGATTTLKNSAAPNHIASNSNRAELRISKRLSSQTHQPPPASVSSAAQSPAASIHADQERSTTTTTLHRVAPDTQPGRAT